MGGWFNAERDGFYRHLVQPSRVRQSDPKHPVCRGWGAPSAVVPKEMELQPAAPRTK